jgi:hypothetical protein
MFTLETAMVRLSRGYAVIRSLTPLDNVGIAEILGDKINNDAIAENAIVAFSLVSISYPEKGLTDYMILDPKNPDNKILDPENPDNYIADSDDASKTILDPENPHNYILNPDRPHNYIPDMSKLTTKQLKPIQSYEDLMERMRLMPLKDWILVSREALTLNSPDPEMLGK